ncbi:MAG TPA: hypothetical protein PKN75_13545 [Bacteroidia bacterium]|nr:hypothetical protein [Bacteroidia bacterium]HNU34607.1 hypothetical protein [Bacteroidia bacterium]
MQDFTNNDLILYYFNETQLNQTVATQNAIDTYPEIEQEYETMVAIFEKIDGVLLNPSEKSIQKILFFI